MWLGARVSWAQTPAPPDVPAPVLAVEGRAIYRAACAPCHGLSGDGNGPAARSMNPRPRDLTAGVFKFRSTPSGALPTDLDLYRTISQGVPGTWMPAWKDLLSERQRWAVVQHVKTLAPDFQIELAQMGLADDAPLRPPGEPARSASVREGRFVYLVLKCWDCHGMNGRGDGPSAGSLKDDQGRRIKPYDFTRGSYKNGRRPEDVYRTLRTGLDGTPMPAYGPDVVLFPGGPSPDLSQYAQILGPDELAALREYLAAQPDRVAVQALSNTEGERLLDRRLSSLVEYLKSLSRSTGLLYRLFAEDVNATPPGRVP